MVEADPATQPTPNAPATTADTLVKFAEFLDALFLAGIVPVGGAAAVIKTILGTQTVPVQPH